MKSEILRNIQRVILGSLPDCTGAGRSVGYHLTDVLRFIQDRSGIGYSGKGFSDIQLTQDIGFIWERVAEIMSSDKELARAVWAEKFEEAWKSLQSIRLGEIEYDGIICSPDGIGSDPLEEFHIAVHEYKCTWKSTKQPPTDNWYYMSQLKGYCKVIGTQCAVMQIIYLMGDYKGSGPQWLPVRIVFTQTEIDENWEMIKNNLDYMKLQEG